MEPLKRLTAFLCHASEDKEAVSQLFQRLRGDGFEPWLDSESLLPGQDWDREIRNAVGGCDVVLVCASQRSIGKTGFVQKELRYALDLADERPEGTIYIVPVRLDECELPSRLRKWHHVDLFRVDGYRRLIASLKLVADARKRSRARTSVADHDFVAADAISKAFLPATLASSTNLDVAIRISEPMGAGIYYDSFRLPDARVGICIGEAFGWGLPGVFQVAVIRACARVVAARELGHPDRVLSTINDFLTSSPSVLDGMVHLWYGEYEPSTRHLRYSRSGLVMPFIVQPPSAISSKERQTLTLNEGAPPLGLPMPELAMEWPVGDVVLKQGATLVIYTSGMYDAVAGDTWGVEERVSAYTRENSAVQFEQLCDGVFGEVQKLGTGTVARGAALLIARGTSDAM